VYITDVNNCLINTQLNTIMKRNVEEIESIESVVRDPTKIMENVSFNAMHGRAAGGLSGEYMLLLKPPLIVRVSDKPARPGYERTMLSHEYVDQEITLRYKISTLADLVRRSKHCVVYAGAGLSTSAGIGDYASRDNPNSLTMAMISKKSRREVRPALGHRAIVALHKAGYIKELIQQNHDGLPQKAGMPQHIVNEIHGAWFDPSNPVVSMSGSLRGDLVERFDQTAHSTDLVLALGTSLAATNADRIVEIATQKRESFTSLGAVIVSLQQTYFDNVSALRIFATLDDVLSMLASELEVNVPEDSEYSPDLPVEAIISEDLFHVPYDSSGELIRQCSTTSEGGEDGGHDTGGGKVCVNGTKTVWDLRAGSRVIIMYGPGAGKEGQMVGKQPDGTYLVHFPRILGHGDDWLVERDRKKNPDVDPCAPRVYSMGSWWVESATKGLCDRLPFVSIPDND
jgi:NAD-dependent SIR2 family protein deacetylase